MQRLLALAVLGCGAHASAPSLEAPPPPPPSETLRFDIGAVDRSADPCTDFYAYACGNWVRAHPVPPDHTRWSRYAELEDLNGARERRLVEAAPRDGTSRVGTYYAACLDQPGIDARGIAPIRDLMQRIDEIRVPGDVTAVLADLHRRVTPVLFDLEVGSDPRDVRRTMAMLDDGELGLSSPEYYTRGDAEALALRDKYRTHIERVLRMVGDRDPADSARRVVELETALARALPSASERRDDAKWVHIMTPTELAGIAPAIDWPRYLRELGAVALDNVDVQFVPYLQAVSAAIAGDLAGVRAYLRYQIVRKFAAVLPTALDAEVFDFAARTLRGAREMSPRWQLCLDLVDRDLGDDVGRMFVAAYFPAASHAGAQALVTRIVAALRRDLATLDWLGDAARTAAIAKLDNMRFTIGQPAHWKSYDDVVVRPDDPVGNAERAIATTSHYELGKLGKPTDRDEFFAPTQSLDGFGTKSLVSVGFTAGILQPPVFDAQIDEAINLGGFGGVIGHEITHHFDDVGREYDVDGNIGPWWSADDVASYQRRAACFVDEYSQFAIEDGTHVDGKLTLGENLADNGGLRLAWNAFLPASQGPAIDGFTPAQRFFLAWAQIRCENATPEAARAQVQSDGHAPGRWRVDGVVRNMPELAAAFSCKAGTPMAPVERCRLW